MILRKKEIEINEGEEFRVDILWGGKKQNAGLMLALAFLIQENQKWPKTKMAEISGQSGPNWPKLNLSHFFYHTFHLSHLGSNSERYHVNTSFELQPDGLLNT